MNKTTSTNLKRFGCAIGMLCVLAMVLPGKEATPASPLQPTDAGPIAQAALTATYIANEGFLFESGGKKVLIDAVFDKKNQKYAAPTPELLQQMTEGRGPFDKVDLLLISHYNSDHFDSRLVAQFMRNHPATVLIAHRQVVAELRTTEGFASFEKRIREFDLAPGNSAHLDIDGISVDLMCLYHAGGARGATLNLAFSVSLGGKRFLHLGDSTLDQNVEELKSFPFEKLPTDVLLIEYFDRSLMSQAMIKERIKPSHIVAMHAQPAQFAATRVDVRAVYPDAFLFEKAMEQHRFQP